MMKVANKAAFYSGLIFPGLGLWLIKQRVLSMLFMLPAAIALCFLVWQMWDISYAIADQLAQQIVLTGQFDFNVLAIMTQIRAAVSENDTLLTAKWAFIGVWLLSILVSYGLGLRQERKMK